MLRRTDKTEASASREHRFAVAQREHDAHTSVIAIAGELDLSTAPQLKWALLDRVQAGGERLVLDFSAVEFMDSTALGVLIAVNRGLARGAQLAIVGASPRVLKVFELSGMDGAFEFHATLEQALPEQPGRAAAEAG